LQDGVPGKRRRRRGRVEEDPGGVFEEAGGNVGGGGGCGGRGVGWARGRNKIFIVFTVRIHYHPTY